MQNIFGFIIHPMELGLVWLASTVGNAGIGIILFTVFVRLVLAPLQIVQLRNAKAMQRLQPLMAELKQKHGKDKQKMTEATMALYKEHNVNPAMGCLPTLLQFPILIGLFYALLHLGQSPKWYQKPKLSLVDTCNGHVVHGWAQWLQGCYSISGVSNTQHVFNLFHAQFLWLSNGLGAHDPLYILPALAGITQWIQSRMMLTRSVDPQQQMMNNLMNFMPLMIVFFALNYASGLSLYWVTSTLIGIAIQYKITGLGLLPETLQGWLGSLRGAGAGPRGSGGGPRGGTPGNGARAAARPPRSSGGPARGQAARDDDTQVKELAPRPTLVGKNGTDGADEVPQTAAAVVRPRKKANRARGGRSGGRRG